MVQVFIYSSNTSIMSADAFASYTLNDKISIAQFGIVMWFVQ